MAKRINYAKENKRKLREGRRDEMKERLATVIPPPAPAVPAVESKNATSPPPKPVPVIAAAPEKPASVTPVVAAKSAAAVLQSEPQNGGSNGKRKAKTPVQEFLDRVREHNAWLDRQYPPQPKPKSSGPQPLKPEAQR